MNAKELPEHPNLDHYKKIAKDLLKAYKSGDPASLKRMEDFAGSSLSQGELREAADRQLRRRSGARAHRAGFTLADAQFLIARFHAFDSWPKFKTHIEALAAGRSDVSAFEMAADAVVTGDIAALRTLLLENPELIRARSTRAHRSTLLHYTSANGVEDFRQKTPGNAVKVTRFLLEAGAEVDAENNPGRGTTLGLVATSLHPAKAGVQIELIETLLASGASVDGQAGGWSPLTAALANGRGEAAEFLAARGARLDLEGAAGVGRLDVVGSFFNDGGGLHANATREQMEAGFMWACEYGRTAVVEFLLAKGFDAATARRCTGLHWAALSGHVSIVNILLTRKPPVNSKDESFGGTPLDWALYGWNDPPPTARQGNHCEVVRLLVAAGARAERSFREDSGPGSSLYGKAQAHPRMRAALAGETGG